MTALATSAPAPAPALSAAALDAALGDAWDPQNPYGVWALADPTMADPADRPLYRTLRGAGLHLAILPPAYGGTLVDLPETMLTVRAAARRDLGVMPATLISVTAVAFALVADDPVATAAIAEAVRRGDPVGFAMSEEATGSDVLATRARFSATPDGDHLLTGRKWLMGGGRDARLAVVLAVHEGRRGPGAFSAALVELPPGAVLAPTPTLGMPRTEFADLVLDAQPVVALIGRPGRGLEVAMRSQHLVRIMSTIASVAALDTGLRLASRYSDERATADLPVPRRLLGAASVELVLADLVSQTAARLVHTAPGAIALASVVAKWLVPELARSALSRAGDLLGARSVLAQDAGAVLDRLRADNEVVRYIDTSVAAVLRTVDMQLAAYDRCGLDRSERVRATLEATFDLGADLPPLELGALTLGLRADDPVLLGLADAADAVLSALGTAPADRELPGRIEWLRGRLDALITRHPTLSGADAEVDRMVLATELCWLYAGACCLHAWSANRTRSLYGADPGWTGWLDDCLAHVRAAVEGAGPAGSPPARSYDRTRDRVLDLVRSGLAVTAQPFPFAEEAS